MLVSIGSKPESGFDEPLGMLRDCHRRIEWFLGVLIGIAEGAGGTFLDDEEREALRKSLAFFRDTAPRHTADEEDSLLPLLRAGRSDGIRLLDDRLTALEGDHVLAEGLHVEADRYVELWLKNDFLEARAARRLIQILHALQALYRDHMRVEETEVFPAAARLFDAAALRQLGEEMAARRGIAFVSTTGTPSMRRTA